MTLVSQIGELPVTAREAFVPSDTPVLSLVVSSGTAQHAACFYPDEAGSAVSIVSGDGDTRRYRQTDGWRVGTLLMTCEGTRIQDERGNETPAY